MPSSMASAVRRWSGAASTAGIRSRNSRCAATPKCCVTTGRSPASATISSVACDADRARLSRLAPRAERAGAGPIDTRLLDPGRETAALADLAEAADVVLVDAPCSGTGTWRRNPEARWRLNAARLDRLAALQARLIRVAAGLVKPGGHLVYIVCSLLDEEGAGQIDGFLHDYPGWMADGLAPVAGRPHRAGYRLTPAVERTDGFFVARLKRP